MLIDFLTLFLSLLVIYKSSEFLVKAAVRISKRFGISNFMIGLIVLAIGTSLPELFTSITASFLNEPGVSQGTIIGGNIVNITLILGIGVAISKVQIKKEEWFVQGVIMAMTTIFAVVLMIDGLSRMEGIILLVFFGVYMYEISKVKAHREIIKKTNIGDSRKPFIILAISLFFLLLGSTFAVESVKKISMEFGIATSIVSALLVTLGTTLPEFIVTIQAARNSHFGLALGNLVGSNITNILFIFGLASAINPFPPFDPSTLLMLPFFVLTPFAAILYLKTGSKIWGAALIPIYFLFVIFTVLGR